MVDGSKQRGFTERRGSGEWDSRESWSHRVSYEIPHGSQPCPVTCRSSLGLESTLGFPHPGQEEVT